MANSDTAVLKTVADDDESSTDSVNLDEAPAEMHTYQLHKWRDEKAPNFLLSLLRQLRPGVDLTRVTLPTIILEPRSLIEKWSDFICFPMDLFCAMKEDDVTRRMLYMLSWFCSGFSMLPPGVRKPYNPVLGETFRCYQNHNKNTFLTPIHPRYGTDIRHAVCGHHDPTVYVAEQVSHHPPISAFFFSNRRAGFASSGWIFTKSKFTGNSAGSILEGRGRMYDLVRGDVYETTFPSCWGRGIFVGSYMMEMSGKAKCVCPSVGMEAKLEFKKKPIIGGNKGEVGGFLKLNGELLYRISGNHVTRTIVEHAQTGEQLTVFDKDVDQLISKRVAPVESMAPHESRVIWRPLTEALTRDPPDYIAGAEAKHAVEEHQRHKRRKRNISTKYFVPDTWPDLPGVKNKVKPGKDWSYKWACFEPFVEGEADVDRSWYHYSRINGALAGDDTGTETDASEVEGSVDEVAVGVGASEE